MSKFDDIIKEHEVELNAVALRHLQTFRKQDGKRPEAIIAGLVAENNRLVNKVRLRINGRAARVKKQLHMLDLKAQINFFTRNPDAEAPVMPSGPAA